MFFPGNKKNQNPIEYKGKRTTEDIISFIINHSYNKIIYNEEVEEEEEVNDDNNKDANNKNEKKNNEKVSDL